MAIVYKNPHEQSRLSVVAELEALRNEEAELQDRRARIAQRVAQLELFLKAIEPLIENDQGQAMVDAGLASLCRDILAKVNRWTTAQEVRHLLATIGVQLEGYTNEMAVLHSTLRRVGDVRQDQTGTYYGKSGLAKAIGTSSLGCAPLIFKPYFNNP